MRRCCKCEIEKPLCDFTADKRCKEGRRAQCKECFKPGRLIRQKNYKKREKGHASELRYRRKLKTIVMSYYCAGEPHCMCPGCDVKILEFLTLDHIEENGADHRRQLGKGTQSCGINTYRWAKNNNYPSGFQVLCFNCNFGKHVCGVCPHVGVVE